MEITTVGLDLAKNVFQLHGTDRNGKVVLTKRLTRNKMLSFFANLTPCLIGMEATGSANYWARELKKLGHTVRLMSPQFVKPYVKGSKNDQNDAEAICEAVGRPNMHFVAVKTAQQQDIQAIHRIRQRLITQRTAKANQTRGLLAEYGIIVPQGINRLRKQLPFILEDAENGLSPLAAWMGLVPRQHSSGDRRKLLSITKRGDRYLRTLLIHGARSVVRRSEGKSDGRSLWLNNIKERRNKNIAAVALANKNARIIWALLARGEDYRAAV